MKKILLGVIYLSLTLSSSYGVSLGYKEDAPYSYGAGVDVDFPLLKKESCIDYDEPVLIDGGASVQFESKIVKESSEVIEKLSNNLDVTASGHWGKVKIGAGFNRLSKKEKEQLDESTFMMISAKIDYGRKSSKNFRLYPEYQRLVDEGKHDEFIRRCGNYFVDTEHNKAVVTAVIKAKGLTNSLKKKVINSLNLSVSAPSVGKVEVKNTSSKIFSTLQKYSDLEVNFYANSGAGASSLKDIILASSKVNYEEIIKAISHYVEKIDKDNTPPYSYDLTSMSFFGLKMPEMNLKRQNYLENAYISYLNGKNYEEKLERIEKDSGLREGTLAAQRNRIKSYMTKIERLALQCYDDIDGSKKQCERRIPTLSDLSLEHIEKVKVKMDCQYIATDRAGHELLDNLVVSIDGKLSFWNLIEENSIKILKEGENGAFEKVKGSKIIFSDHLTYGSKMRFLINYRTDRLFGNASVRPKFSQENFDLAEKNYDTEKNSLYYLEVSDLNNNHFVYYLGRPSGYCSIDNLI